MLLVISHPAADYGMKKETIGIHIRVIVSFSKSFKYLDT